MLTAAFAILRAVPWRVWAALALLLALVGMAAALRHQTRVLADQRAQTAAQAARAERAEATAAAEAAARASEAAINDATRRAADAYRARLAQTRRDADAVRDERDRLLVAVDATGTGACAAGAAASAPGGADGAAGLREVVRQCVGALAQVAEAADASESRLSGLQDYVRAVGLAPAASAPP